MNDQAMFAARRTTRVEIASTKVFEGYHSCSATEIPWAATDADQRMSSPQPLSSVRRVALSFKGVDTVTLGL